MSKVYIYLFCTLLCVGLQATGRKRVTISPLQPTVYDYSSASAEQDGQMLRRLEKICPQSLNVDRLSEHTSTDSTSLLQSVMSYMRQVSWQEPLIVGSVGTAQTYMLRGLLTQQPPASCTPHIACGLFACLATQYVCREPQRSEQTSRNAHAKMQ